MSSAFARSINVDRLTSVKICRRFYCNFNILDFVWLKLSSNRSDDDSPPRWHGIIFPVVALFYFFPPLVDHFRAIDLRFALNRWRQRVGVCFKMKLVSSLATVSQVEMKNRRRMRFSHINIVLPDVIVGIQIVCPVKVYLNAVVPC